eukprot:GHRQ01025651.1.p1 GENE.GHRQ01025651.1~~GHRQ01025651.1.p1  ORF type:complete len:109 (-),score=29.47 GHRQ01025651.1:397-723(-)
MCTRWSSVLLTTMRPSALVTTTPPELQRGSSKQQRQARAVRVKKNEKLQTLDDLRLALTAVSRPQAQDADSCTTPHGLKTSLVLHKATNRKLPFSVTSNDSLPTTFQI